MFSNPPPYVGPEPTLDSPVRALFSLREADAEAAETAVVLLGPDWEIRRHETPDGHLLLLLTREDDERCFALHRSAAGVGLLDLHGDAYRRLGVFEGAAAAVWHAQQVRAQEEAHATAAA